MVRSAFALLTLALLVKGSPAAVFVVGNYTLQPVALNVAEPGAKPREVRLEPFQLTPIIITGPAEVNFANRKGPARYRVLPYMPYVLQIDDKEGVILQGIELPGEALPEDGKASDGPPPKSEPYKYPVTLYVDDQDPRTDRVWQADLRRRFDEAANVVEKHSGIRFEFKGFGTWNASNETFEPSGMLEDFEKKVRIKDGELALGYSSRKVDDKNKDIPFGACRGALGTHLLMRELRPKNEAEKVEALIHYLGEIAGAAESPDEGSVMRTKIANGIAINPKYRMRFDPLNTLAMSIWAEELRKGPRLTLADVTPANKLRLGRVYKAMSAAMPDDKLAQNYATEFDNAMAVRPRANPPAVADPDPMATPPVPPVRSGRTPLQDAVRVVLQAVVARADLNSRASQVGGEGEIVRLQGDALMEAYIRAAADASATVEEQFRVSAFLVGLGIALDDAGLLAVDPVTDGFAKAVETDSEKQRRLALIGQPTLRSRRDLCRRFATACATADILGASSAEDMSVKSALQDMEKPAGFSFAAAAADYAGIEMAQQVKGNGELISKWRKSFHARDVMPSLDGLRDGVSRARFDHDFGNAADPRFANVMDDIRNRLSKLPAYKRMD